MKKSKILLILAFVVVACCTIAIYRDDILAGVNGQNVGISEDNKAIRSIEFARQQGINMKAPTQEEVLKAMFVRQLYEKEFVAENITLTQEEQSYIDSYLSEFLALANEDINKGRSEKENAELVLNTINDFKRFTHIIDEEYAQMVVDEMTYQIKCSKLVQQKYDGNWAALKSVIESRYQLVWGQS